MRRANASRLGFTLIELLVVMAIIGLLIGLLLPAVQKIRQAALRARCKAEIGEIGTSIENFKSTYDVKYIPTAFILSNNYNPRNTPFPGSSLAATNAALADSRDFYAKVWPKGFIPSAPGTTPVPTNVTDIFMDGSQLIVFLLGGIPPADANPSFGFSNPNWRGTRTGFLNSPSNPFNLQPVNGPPPYVAGPPSSGAQAKGPFLDFKQNRIDPTYSRYHDPYWDPTSLKAGNATLSVYYYFSSRSGNDYNYYGLVYQPVFNPSASAGGFTAQGGYGGMNPHIGMDGKYIQAQEYQIVSPGLDQNPGPGSTPGNNATYYPGGSGYLARPGADDLANFARYVLGSDN